MARGRHVQCQIIGSGPAWSALWKHIADVGLQGRVVLAGAQPHTEIRRALQGASIYVQSAGRDAAYDVPTTLIEAMALGVPVLATRTDVHMEYVIDGETGLITPPDVPSALADAIIRLDRDESLARTLARAARARIIKGNDLRHTVLLFHTLLITTRDSLAQEYVRTHGELTHVSATQQ